MQNYKDIAEALSALNEAKFRLENAYIEGEGEVTEETEAQEEIIAQLKGLLAGEGIDILGQWLKSVEDAKAELKAQKDFVSRRIAACDNTIDFVKAKIYEIMKATGQDKVKGSLGYSFTRTESRKSTVLTDALDDAYLDLATEAARAAGLPAYVDVVLKTTTGRINEYAEANDGEGAAFVSVETSPAVRFAKPRASKKED